MVLRLAKVKPIHDMLIYANKFRMLNLPPITFFMRADHISFSHLVLVRKILWFMGYVPIRDDPDADNPQSNWVHASLTVSDICRTTPNLKGIRPQREPQSCTETIGKNSPCILHPQSPVALRPTTTLVLPPTYLYCQNSGNKHHWKEFRSRG